MKDIVGAKVSIRCAVGVRQIARGRIIGKVEKIDPKTGKVLKTWNNTATSDFKKLTAQGCAVGTFNAINKGKFDFSVGDATVDAIYFGGGTGAEDYVIFDISYTASGGAKTINNLYIGYDIGGGGEKIYCENLGMSDPVADQQTVTYRWTITFAYDSGPLEDDYRKEWAKMIKEGTFTIPDDVSFYEVTPPGTQHDETAVLNAGGDGIETWHEWTATYTSSGNTTIDIIKLWYNHPGGFAYVVADITDVSLGDTYTLATFIRIEHL